MLTLDLLALQAQRALDVVDGPEREGAPPYRGSAGCPLARRVELPTTAEEARRAALLFLRFVGTAVGALTVAGMITTHGLELIFGPQPTLSLLVRTLLWFLGWTGGLMALLAIPGLVHELRRFRAVRRAVGPKPLLRADGSLMSPDGEVVVRLPVSRAVSAPGFRDGPVG
jgi:hypothetical protein